MNEDEKLLDKMARTSPPLMDLNKESSPTSLPLSHLPPYEEEDTFVAPSVQSTLYSLDSTTKEFLANINCPNISLNANCSMSSCGQCERCLEGARSRTINISRLTYNLSEFDADFRDEDQQMSNSNKRKWARSSCRSPMFGGNRLLMYLFRFVPFFNWIRHYDWAANINSDVFAGITIAVFQVPQCMGYSLLAKVPPIYGLYSSFLSPLFYTLLGTSRHNSVGTFAIISLMTGSVISDLSNKPNFVPGKSEIEIATLIAFLIGVYQVLFALMRLGFLAQFMSEQLTSGFICASAIYVLSSQLGYITGIKNVKTSGTGAFSLITFYRDLIPRLATESNKISLSISAICVVVLLVYKFYFLPLCQKSHKLSIRLVANLPFELLLVSLFTFLSWFFELKKHFGVSILGDIPSGLPNFTNLEYNRIWEDELWKSCIPLAIVAFAVTYSTGVTFATKHNYEVVPNQELFAIGVTNTVGAYFRCIPTAASLSRSALQESIGGRSQIASIISSFCILIVLLFLSPLLSCLPKCVLASIICVALKSLFLKAADFPRYSKLDRIDGSIWIVSFLAVVIFNVDIGLYIGIAYSLLTLISKSQRPKTYLLGVVGNTNVFVPMVHYPKARELTNIKIFQFCGPLHFANANYFKRKLAEKTKMKRKNSDSNGLPFAIIIDCSMFSYIDASGINTLRHVYNYYKQLGVRVIYADVAAHVSSMMAADTNFHHDVPRGQMYIKLHDAVHRALEEWKQEGAEKCDQGPIEKGHGETTRGGTPENPFLLKIHVNRVEEMISPKVKKKEDETEFSSVSILSESVDSGERIKVKMNDENADATEQKEVEEDHLALLINDERCPATIV